MKKKYLIKQPSHQQLLSSDYSTLNQLSHHPEQKSRRSQNKGLKNIEKARLKTDWPTAEPELSRVEHGASNDRSKISRGLKKSESSLGHIRKCRYYLPSNKEN